MKRYRAGVGNLMHFGAWPSRTVPYRGVHVGIIRSYVLRHEVPDFVFYTEV